MSQTILFCVTCLSNSNDSISIPSKFSSFLENILGIKLAPRSGQQKIICLQCYRTFAEMTRFYEQLLDVQHYFKEEIVPEKPTTEEPSPAIDPIDNSSALQDLNSKTSDNSTAGDCNDGSETITESLKCAICYRVYEDVEEFAKHMRWHNLHQIASTKGKPREKKFQCGFCEKKFSKESGKREHEVTHTDLRPHKCDMCPKTFRQPSALHRHRSNHLGNRVECSYPECTKRFTTKYHMLKHYRVHENGFQCDVCKEIFKQPQHLEDHKLIHTPYEYKCKYCNQVCTSRRILQTHLSVVHILETNGTNDLVDDLQSCLSNLEPENGSLIEVLDDKVLG